MLLFWNLRLDSGGHHDSIVPLFFQALLRSLLLYGIARNGLFDFVSIAEWGACGVPLFLW